MKKGTLIIVILIFLIIASITLYAKQGKKTYMGSESAIGNTGGNLINGGLYCEDDGSIYFSNPNDNGALYEMDTNLSNYKKINNDKAGYINSAGKYIYYSRLNYEDDKKNISLLNFNNSGLYRINKDGSKIMRISSDIISGLSLYGNNIYYQNLSDPTKLGLYSSKIDNTNQQHLTDETIYPASILDNRLYYSATEKNHFIMAMDLSSNQTITILEDNTYSPIINNGYIYYLSLSDNYTINRVDLDGSNPTTLIDMRCSTFNLSIDGDYLYYQVDDTKNNGLYKLNLKSKNITPIISGNYNQINVTNEFVFFRNFMDTETFYFSIYDDILKSFNPVVITNK